jgi:hypothetical protein
MEINTFDVILCIAYMFVFLLLCAFIFAGMLFDRLPKLVATCIGTIGAIAALSSIYIGVTIVKADFDTYQAEGVCVAKLIAVNVERKDIVTINGDCYVR